MKASFRVWLCLCVHALSRPIHSYLNGSELGYSPEFYGNPDLTWEKQKTFDVGVDFRLFDRVYGSFEYFYRRTDDMLFKRPVAYSTAGRPYNWENLGAMKNTGIEFEVNVDIFNQPDLKWTVSLVDLTTRTASWHCPKKTVKMVSLPVRSTCAKVRAALNTILICMPAWTKRKCHVVHGWDKRERGKWQAVLPPHHLCRRNHATSLENLHCPISTVVWALLSLTRNWPFYSNGFSNWWLCLWLFLSVRHELPHST